MNIISKIEKKFGRYSIRNLTLYLIIGYGIGYVVHVPAKDTVHVDT